MHTAETLERACADAWPPLVEDKLGDWRLRAADGFTGRANSVLAVGDPGMPTGAALHHTCEFSHFHGIEPRAQVLCGSDVEAEVTAAGWHPDMTRAAGSLVSVQLGPLPATSGARAEVLSAPPPQWWELVAGTAEPTVAQRHVLTGGRAGPEVGYCVAGADGAAAHGLVAGAARGVIVDDLLFLSGLAVRPDHRRQGLAMQLMSTLGGWAGDRGATHCVLQVAVGNDAALALYARLGFAESHRYGYWVPRDCFRSPSVAAGERASETDPVRTCEDHTL